MNLFPQEVIDKAEWVIRLLIKKEMMTATAESCTGGLIAAALTEVSGSSAVVDRGFVTYSNDAKMDMLGVQADTLKRFGAVSQQTAFEMAKGALSHSKAQIAIAVTGIAGPGGGSAEKPVGLVHLAVASQDGRLAHREMLYGDIGRDKVRMATVATALDMILDLA